MNEKIIFPELISLVSIASGRDKKLCEEFVRELISVASDTLVNGDSLKIKGLGTFKVAEMQPRKSVNVNTGEDIVIPGYKKIKFSVEKNLAEIINSPFSAFPTEDLSDGITEDDLKLADDSEQDISDSLAAEETVPPVIVAESTTEEILPVADTVPVATQPIEEPKLPESEKVDTDIVKEDVDNTVEDIPLLTPEDMSTNDSQEIITEETIVEDDLSDTLQTPVTNEETFVPEENNYSEEEYVGDIEVAKHRSRFGLGFMWGAIAAVVLLCGGFALWRVFAPASFCNATQTVLLAEYNSKTRPLKEQPKPSDTKNVKTQTDEETPTKVESEKLPDEDIQAVEEVAPTAPSDATPTYDVISKTRFLTTMAKDHYGDYNLWPYIYEENKSILGHPDRIKPGTKIVIPPASKYGIDATNKECVAKAKKKGAEIYARYNK